MLHCNSAALASSDMSGRAYKILMEMEIWRDRLDHILESAVRRARQYGQGCGQYENWFA
jgi:hypothetical protein